MLDVLSLKNEILRLGTTEKEELLDYFEEVLALGSKEDQKKVTNKSCSCGSRGKTVIRNKTINILIVKRQPLCTLLILYFAVKLLLKKS